MLNNYPYYDVRPSVPKSEWNANHELSFHHNYSYNCANCSALEKKLFDFEKKLCDVQAENIRLKDQLRKSKKQCSKIQCEFDDILKPNPLIPKG